jgi:hypothetical protein
LEIKSLLTKAKLGHGKHWEHNDGTRDKCSDRPQNCRVKREGAAKFRMFSEFEQLSYIQPVDLLGPGISPSQGRYPNRTAQTQNESTQTSMPWMGFETTIPVFERAKTARPATVIGSETRTGPSGICGGQSGVRAGFIRVLRFPLPFIPPISPSSQSPRAGTIGQWVADVPSGPRLDSTPHYANKIK